MVTCSVTALRRSFASSVEAPRSDSSSANISSTSRWSSSRISITSRCWSGIGRLLVRLAAARALPTTVSGDALDPLTLRAARPGTAGDELECRPRADRLPRPPAPRRGRHAGGAVLHRRQRRELPDGGTGAGDRGARRGRAHPPLRAGARRLAAPVVAALGARRRRRLLRVRARGDRPAARDRGGLRGRGRGPARELPRRPRVGLRRGLRALRPRRGGGHGGLGGVGGRGGGRGGGGGGIREGGRGGPPPPLRHHRPPPPPP